MKLIQTVSALALALVVSVAAAPAAHAADDTIRVATDATFPPLEFVKDGKRTGFDIELIDAMAKTMGKKVQWVDIDFKGLIPGLIANRFDVAASGPRELVIRAVPALLAEPVRLEVAVVGTVHLIFAGRVWIGRRASGRQRAIELERFRRIKHDSLPTV